MTGTGLCETQYRLTLPILGAPIRAPNFCNFDSDPRVPTMRAVGERGRIGRSVITGRVMLSKDRKQKLTIWTVERDETHEGRGDFACSEFNNDRNL